MNRSSNRLFPARPTPHDSTAPEAPEVCSPGSGTSSGHAASPGADVLEASSRFERLLLARLRALEGAAPEPPRLIW